MWKMSIIAGLAALIGLAGTSFAQDNPQLSEADCLALWSKADMTGSGSVDNSQAQPYVSDFAAVDSNADGKLTQTEFQTGCSNGLIQDSAASGAGAGTEGSDVIPPASPSEAVPPPAAPQE